MQNICTFSEFGCDKKRCKKKYKSGIQTEYCIHHYKLSLLDETTGYISFQEFTKKESDYLKKDILHTLSRNKRIFQICLPKTLLFQNLLDLFERLESYNTPEISKKVSRIQKCIRNYNYKKKYSLHGPGYFRPSICKNDTDFLSFETYTELDKKYFFSYKDRSNNVWFFDIRSFYKLITMRHKNPYTRERISRNIRERAIQLYNQNVDQQQEQINEVSFSRDELIKQRTINLFSSIEQHGYECHFDWFLSLDHTRLKKLYRELEDLWSYRLQLSPEMKVQISPPNGIVFRVSHTTILESSKQGLQEIILEELSKLHNSPNESNRKLGSIYFLIGLGTVSRECYLSHGWLMII